MNCSLDTRSYSFKLCDLKFEVSLEKLGNSSTMTKPAGTEFHGFHYHAKHELFFALNSPIQIQTSDGSYEYENQLFSIPPHYDHVAKKGENFKLLFTFKPVGEPKNEFSKFMFSTFSAESIAVLKPGEHTKSLLSEVLRSFNCDRDVSEEMTISALKLLFSDIYLGNTDNPPRPTSRGNESYLLKIDNILSHYQDDITLATVAEILGICPRHASRIIKKNYGTTLSALLERKRLTVARELLIRGNMSIAEIVEYVNFPSASYFYSRFKKVYGTTPINYRTDNTIYK